MEVAFRAEFPVLALGGGERLACEPCDIGADCLVAHIELARALVVRACLEVIGMQYRMVDGQHRCTYLMCRLLCSPSIPFADP